jgi:hypothetical protein
MPKGHEVRRRRRYRVDFQMTRTYAGNGAATGATILKCAANATVLECVSESAHYSLMGDAGAIGLP